LNSKNKALAKAKADKYFSQYIRMRDSYSTIMTANCCTCGKYTTQFDCGHFISRRFEATRYDEKNAHAQCLKCNRFENGNQFAHAQFIDEKYGKGTAESLMLKSKMACHRSKEDYEAIAKYFKEKLANCG
jgi:hypothetical protein